jgi:amino acid adenylation domain-containing protein
MNDIGDDMSGILESTRQPDPGALGPPETLVGVFREVAARYPEVAAVGVAGAMLTYGELDRLSDAVAAQLIDRFPAAALRDITVGLSVGRGLEMAAGILGILKAGAAWLPLEPLLPQQRLQYMLRDSGTVVVLCDDEGASRLGPVEGVTMMRLPAHPGASATTLSQPRSTDSAYVIYTSGSTGQPKGVVVEHAGAARLARAHATLFGLGPDSRVALYASIAFDASVSEMFAAFAAGATLYIADEVERRSPEALSRFLERDRIEVVTLPPLMLGRLARRPLPDLRTIVVAGETGRAEDLDSWAGRCRVVNAYGPTEATVCACAAEYHPGDPPTRIGRALPYVVLEVLDAEGLRVPVGVDGELFIGGGGVARGYLGRPELTDQRFIDLPAYRGRFFRTGDRVRWLEPGILEFRGRLDEQVKINGARVEPDEVARVLETLEGVADAAVVSTGGPGALKLVAFVTGPSFPPSPRQIAARLAEILPDYMLPARYMIVPELPIGNSGKLDRAALARLAEAPTGVVEDPPVTPTEIAIAGLWCEALNLPAVSRRDNFYELGGDSLRVTAMLLRMNRTMGTALVASRFRRLATLADLAAYVDLTAAKTNSAASSYEL